LVLTQIFKYYHLMTYRVVGGWVVIVRQPTSCYWQLSILTAALTSPISVQQFSSGVSTSHSYTSDQLRTDNSVLIIRTLEIEVGWKLNEPDEICYAASDFTQAWVRITSAIGRGPFHVFIMNIYTQSFHHDNRAQAAQTLYYRNRIFYNVEKWNKK